MVRYGQACRLLGVLVIFAVLRGGDSAVFVAAEKAAQTDAKVAAVDDDEDSPSAADARHWSGFSRALDGANANANASANIIDAIASGDAGSLGLADADPLQGGTTRATNGNNDNDKDQGGGRELYTPKHEDGGTRGYSPMIAPTTPTGFSMDSPTGTLTGFPTGPAVSFGVTSGSTSCSDSTLRLKISKNGDGTNIITRSCLWVARTMTAERCNLPGVSAACPVTCNSCDTCEDPELRFKFTYNDSYIARGCEFVGRIESKISGRCAASENICRKTCGTCSALTAPPTGSPTGSPSKSAAPTTTCDRDNVGTFGELVDRIEAATGPTVESIGVCPGMYTFTQDINFDLRRFELFCVSQSLCTFDLSGHSFTSGLGTIFSVSFQGFTMQNGNGQNRPSSGIGQVPALFDKTFGKTGGAILAFAAGEQSLLDIRNCGFFRNEALGGGAVAAFGNVDVTLDVVVFLQNAAITDPQSTSDFQGLGGAFLADDGVVFTGGPDSQLSVSVNGTRFQENAALVAGGAIEFSPPRPMSITETDFIENKAWNDGGAIASYEGGITMDEVTFNRNSAGYSGGAIIYGPSATGSISNAQFRNNFNAIVGRPPSPDIHRLEENGNIASVVCGSADVVFCDATGNPTVVTTNSNNVTCAGATIGICTTTRADDSPDGGSQLPSIDINRGEQEPTMAWSWPRTRISVSVFSSSYSYNR